MGRPFCKNFSILVKRPRGSTKKSDWFRCKKISQKLKYLNFKCEQSERYFFKCEQSERYFFKCEQSERYFFRPDLFVSPLCACPVRKFRWGLAKISLGTSEMCEWKSGLRIYGLNPLSDHRFSSRGNFPQCLFLILSYSSYNRHCPTMNLFLYCDTV